MNLKKIIKFLSTSVVIQGVNLILTFLAIKFLSLNNLGKYNIAKSIGGTFQYANLGYRYALDRKLPESEDDNLNKIRFSICFYSNCIVSIVILLFFAIKYHFDWFYILYGIGGSFISNFTLIRIFLRGTGKVDEFIKSSFYGGVIPIILPILGLIVYNLWGVGIAFFIAAVIVFAIYFKKDYLISIRHITKYFRYSYLMFKMGLIIYLTNLFVFAANNFDRFILEYHSGLDAVGEYGIVILVFSLSLIIPSSILEMVFPTYIKNKSNIDQIKKDFMKHIGISILMIGGFIFSAYLLIPTVIPMLIKKYISLIEPMQIILMAIIPYIFINPIYGVLFAFDLHKKILLANIIATFIYLGTMFILLKDNYDISKLVYLKIGYAYAYLILLFIFLIFNKNKIYGKSVRG